MKRRQVVLPGTLAKANLPARVELAREQEVQIMKRERQVGIGRAHFGWLLRRGHAPGEFEEAGLQTQVRVRIAQLPKKFFHARQVTMSAPDYFFRPVAAHLLQAEFFQQRAFKLAAINRTPRVHAAPVVAAQRRARLHQHLLRSLLAYFDP
jgi:hypothetical protein